MKMINTISEQLLEESLLSQSYARDDEEEEGDEGDDRCVYRQVVEYPPAPDVSQQ